MNKQSNSLVWIAALSCGFLAAGPSGLHADPSSAISTTTAQVHVPVPPQNLISGSVTNVDPVNKTIQVKQKDGQLKTVVMDEDVRVTKHGQRVDQADLSVGDSVKVKAAPADGAAHP